ncbi:hypothetical protein C922_05251 [Plasmodium inui San Antonio 1]|uniref:Uncharacterized protein n=1 Tax=Plasmodium inui San Antonio 1 TaxID=1237626 RepID=W6ZYJ3_9APIC|nr:hypothetical protein C922_05251 [Plasmodium inui San Antonio 1]EUD64370.1 hypothetical protein C922_05251 [Plasmodium inui San Antonio 1]
MNYIERNKIETIYKDDYTDFTRLSDFEIFTKDILVSLKKLNILETKRKYEKKYAFANAEQRDKPLAPLSLFITVDDTCNFLKKLIIKKDYCIKLNYIYYPHNKCQNVIPFNGNENSYLYKKNVNTVNSFYCLHGNLNCSETVLFPARTFPIQRFFFVNEYVELEILDRGVPEEEQYIIIESLSVSNLMLNALKQAHSELEISLPTFVAVDKNYYIYHGHFYTSDYTYFKCVHPYRTVHRGGSWAGSGTTSVTANGDVSATVNGTANGTTCATTAATTAAPSNGVATPPCVVPEKANYISVYKGAGFEVNYNSFKFFNYFKCFSYDQLVALFSLFIYLSNVRGKNIYKINVYIKNIYLIDKPQCSHVLRAINLRNRQFTVLKRLIRGKKGRADIAEISQIAQIAQIAGRERKKENQTYRSIKQIYIFKNMYRRDSYDKDIFPHMYLNHIYNYIRRKKFYRRRIFLCSLEKERNGSLVSRGDNSDGTPPRWCTLNRTGEEERRIAIRNYLFSMKNDLFGKPSYYQFSDLRKVKLVDALSDDARVEDEGEKQEKEEEEDEDDEGDNNEKTPPDYSDSSLLFYPCPSVTQNSSYQSNGENGKSRRKSTFEEINRLYYNLRSHKNFPKSERSPFVSIYVLNFINNMEYKILGGMANVSGGVVNDRRKRKQQVTNVWKIRFINNDKYKGKNSFLLKNILRLYYNELLELKKKRNDISKEGCNEGSNEGGNEGGNQASNQESNHSSNDIITSVQHYLMEFMPLKNKDWVRDREISTYSCFNIEEDSTRYYIDKILNNMFSSNKRKVYEWPRDRGATRKLRPRRNAHNECFGAEEAQSSRGSNSNNDAGGISQSGDPSQNGNPSQSGDPSRSPIGGAKHRPAGGNLFVSKIDGELFLQNTNIGYHSLYQKDAKEVHFILKKGDNFPKRRRGFLMYERKGRQGRDPRCGVRKRVKMKGQQRGDSDGGGESGHCSHNGESDGSGRSGRRNRPQSSETKLEQLVRDFLKIKEKYFLCHHEERITILFFYLISHSSNLKTFYYIWNQFFDNIRNKYENNEYIFNDSMFLSYGPLNVYSYSCSILSQYIKALNISTQQFKINEMKNHMKLKKTLSIFCNDSDNALGKDSSNQGSVSNHGSLSNINENEPFVSISQSKSSNSLSGFFKKSTFEENVFYSCEMNDSSSVSNRKFNGVGNENSSPNLEVEHTNGSTDSIARIGSEERGDANIGAGSDENVGSISNPSNNISNNPSNTPSNSISNNPDDILSNNTGGIFSNNTGGIFSNNTGDIPDNNRNDNTANLNTNKSPKRSSDNPGTEKKKANKKSSVIISNFFPYPLNNMELFITKNNGGTKEVNDQDDMITLIHEILRGNNKDSYTYADFTRWYRNNVGKFSYTSQNVLKYCYRSIKDSYFVNVDVGYIKEKYYLKKMFHYVKNNYDYIKKIKCPFNTFFVGELNLDNLLNLNIIDLLDCAFKVFFISYLNSVMNSKLIYIRKIQDILARMFTIIKGIHKRAKRRSKKKGKGNRGGEGSRDGARSGRDGDKEGHDRDSVVEKPTRSQHSVSELDKDTRGKDHPCDGSLPNSTSKDGDGSRPNSKRDHIHLCPVAANPRNSANLAQHRTSSDENLPSLPRDDNEGGKTPPPGDSKGNNEGRCRVVASNRNSANHSADTPSRGNNPPPPHVKSQENMNDSERNSSDNVDICYGSEKKTGYKNSFNINKEENYFKNYSVDSERRRKKNTYSDSNFSKEIKRTCRKRYQIIFNQKLFLLFETCEQMFNKAAWLYQIFNNSVKEKRIFTLINTILESEEKEIAIDPKDQKYFYDFIKNLCLNENNKNRPFDKKWSGSGRSKFHKINKSISSKNLNKTFKSARDRSERSEKGEKSERTEPTERGAKNDNTPSSANNPVINNPYQNLGVSVKVKKNDSQPHQTASHEKNMLNKDKLSLLLHSYNKEQNIQECIIDYVDHSFGDPLYNTPARMYCSVNPVDTTVSFVKTTSIL